MKSRCLSLCLTALLLTQSGSVSTFTSASSGNQEECKIGTVTKLVAEFKAYSDLRRKSFQRTRQTLLDHGVPFNPDLLMDENWRKLLAPAFSRMPEMKKVVHGSALLKGVIIAHTLYLPEKVGLVGDTVLIARHLVFAGEEALIRGPHNIAIFPIETYGLLGRDQASTRPPSNYRMFRASFASEERENLLSKPTTITGGKLTIDVSGCGRTEWQLTKGLKSSRDPVIMALIQSCSSANGQAGADGASYDQVPVPSAQEGTTGSTGADGNCAANSPHGQPGGSPTNGSDGTKGQRGGDGGQARPDTSSLRHVQQGRRHEGAESDHRSVREGL